MRKLIMASIILFAVIVLSGYQPSLPKARYYALIRALYTRYIVWQTGDWHTLKTPQAIIRYSLADQDAGLALAKSVGDTTAIIDKDLRYQPEKKALIIIYPDTSSFARSFGWDSDPEAMGVYYNGVIRILSPRMWVKSKPEKNIMTTFVHEGPLLHEYVHLVVDNKTNGNYQRWFTEGLAQYYEDLILKNINRDPILKKPYDLSEMDQKFDYLDDQEWAYAQSYLMVKMLMDEYGSEKMAAFLTELSTDITFTNAFKDTYKMDLPTFYLKFTKIINQAHYLLPMKI